MIHNDSNDDNDDNHNHNNDNGYSAPAQDNQSFATATRGNITYDMIYDTMLFYVIYFI